MSFLDDELRRLGLKPSNDQQQVVLTPEEEESLTSQLVSRTMGGLETAANILDTPGALLRGVLSGDPGGRATGRELLTAWGLTRPNDPNRWEWADGFGLAADIVFDPLTYLTFGAGALTKAGTVAKAAGLSDDAVKIASRTLGRKVGQRVARLSTGIDDLAKTLDPEKLALLEQAAVAQGTTLAELGSQRLGGLVGYDIPFSKAAGALGGTGARSQAVAGALDTAGAYLGQTAPVRYLSQWLDPTVKDTSYGPLQTSLREVKRDTASVGPQIQQQLLDDLNKVGVDANNVDSFRAVLETPDLPDVEAANAFLQSRDLPAIKPETFQVIRQANRRIELQFQELPEMGIEVDPFVSAVGTGYGPRQAIKPLVETKAPEYFTPDGKRVSLTTDNLEKRLPELDFYGGTAEINKFSKDRELNLGALASAGDTVRTMHVIERSPAAREQLQKAILEQTDAIDGDEWSVPPTYDSVISEAVDRRNRRTWEPLTESDKLIQAFARTEGVDPLTLKQLVADEIKVRSPSSDPTRQAYIDYMTHKKTPNWWRKYIYNPKVAADQVPELDVWAGELLENMGVLEGLGDVSLSDVALDYLRKWGSPTRAVLDDQLQDSLLREPQLIQDVLQSRRAELEGTVDLARETPLDTKALEVYDRANAFQGALRKFSPVHAQTGVGIFDNQPLEDIKNYSLGLQGVKDSANAIYRMFASVAVDKPQAGYTPIGEVLDTIPGFAKSTVDETGGRIPSKAEDYYRKLAAEMGASGKEYIPTAARDAAMSVIERMTRPDGVKSFGKILDNVTQVTKFGLTYAPAFYVRNWASGQVMNALGGSYSNPRDYLAASSVGRKLSRGKDVAGKLRIVGYEGLSPTEATQKLREELITHQVVDTTVGEQVQNGPTWAAGTSSAGSWWRTKSGESGFDVTRPTDQVNRFARGGQRLNLPASLGESTPGTAETLFGGATPLERLQAKQPVLQGQTIRSVLYDTGKDVYQTFRDQFVRPGTVREKAGDLGERLFGMGGIGNRQRSTGAIPKMHEALNQLVEVENRSSAYVGLRMQGYSPAAAAARVRSMHIDYGDATSTEKAFVKRLVPFYGFQKGISKFLATELTQRPGGWIGQTIQLTAAGNSNDSYVPEHINEGLAIPNPFKQDSYLVGLGLMHESAFSPFAVGSSLGETLTRSLQKSAGLLSPLIKAPIEQATGVNLFTGRRLEDLHQFPLLNASTVDERLVNSLIGASPLARLSSTARVLADDRKSPLERAIRLGTGLKLTDLSGGAAKAREFEARREVESLLRDNPRVKSFENLYVPAAVRSQLSPSEQKLVKLYELYKQRARKAAAEKAKQAKG